VITLQATTNIGATARTRCAAWNRVNNCFWCPVTWATAQTDDAIWRNFSLAPRPQLSRSLS